MGWRHFEAWNNGKVHIIARDGDDGCRYEIGLITTGKQRVFHRLYIRVTLPNGTEIIGEDQHNLHTALLDLDHKLRDNGFELRVAGIDSRFYETGLSHNSGLGYIDEIGRVHMMDPITEMDGSDDLDATISGAVAGIGSWAVAPDVRKDR